MDHRDIGSGLEGFQGLRAGNGQVHGHIIGTSLYHLELLFIALKFQILIKIHH